MIWPLIRNTWAYLGPFCPAERVYTGRCRVLFFQVILAEQWDDVKRNSFVQEALGKVGPLNVSQDGLILVWPNDLTDQSTTIRLHALYCELDYYSTNSHFLPHERGVLSCPTDVGLGQWPAWLVECGWTFSVPAPSIGLERYSLFPLALLGASDFFVWRRCPS